MQSMDAIIAKTHSPDPPLEELARWANEAHHGAEAKACEALELAMQAGAHLTEAKGRLSHGEWGGWLRDHFHGSERTARGYMRLASHRETIEEAKRQRVADLGIKEALQLLATPPAPGEPQTPRAGGLLDLDSEPAPPATPPEAEAPPPGGATSREALHSSHTPEWYTPGRYVKAAHTVLGSIDLDPASCKEANGTVGASRFFTEAEDGLSREWPGKVWLNPPYGGKTGLWVAKLCEEHREGRTREAVALLNAFTSTGWFGLLWRHAAAVCFTDHRIRFTPGEGGSAQSPTHGSAFVYFGPQVELFAEAFKGFGAIVPTSSVVLSPG